MEFFQKGQCVDSGALQVGRQRLHFSPRVRQVGVADSRRHQAATLHTNFQSAQEFRDAADRIVSTVRFHRIERRGSLPSTANALARRQMAPTYNASTPPAWAERL